MNTLISKKWIACGLAFALSIPTFVKADTEVLNAPSTANQDNSNKPTTDTAPVSATPSEKDAALQTNATEQSLEEEQKSFEKLSESLVKRSPFVPTNPQYQSEDIDMEDPQDNSSFKFCGVMKTSNNGYQFCVSNINTQKSYWINSNPQTQDSHCPIKFCNYDETNKILVVSTPEGKVQLFLPKQNKSTKNTPTKQDNSDKPAEEFSLERFLEELEAEL